MAHQKSLEFCDKYLKRKDIMGYHHIKQSTLLFKIFRHTLNISLQIKTIKIKEFLLENDIGCQM